ncbi:DUF7126 family protein [Natronorubrum thiooxidans]|uniref:CTP synthetase n=1 Tax=Natronorubrum thiooxidans TaxID=308853 RepID=A0A1N7DQ26_9EURY|nr:CTP synthetase [Natronorubrum thiooxidans]SIR77973.1 hypothetical protein SAMN05421752_102430 [Natronorubrum thiooxidans]
MSMDVIVAGPDEDNITEALEATGAHVARVTGVISRPVLEEAGVLEAELYVLTDVSEATTIPIVCDLNDDVRTVVYARDTIPDFIKGQLDLAVDPQLMDAAVVADELTS